MTVELIDGRAGKPHISGDDLGNFKAGFVGIEGYVLETENKLAATLESADKLTINTGAAIMPTTGRHVRITSPETVTIQSGTQGQKRNDLVVLRTATSSDNTTVETANIIVIKGTPTTGTPTDPSINNGDLKLYRLSLDGISVENPVPLFNVLTPLATLGASVDWSSSGEWTVKKSSNGWAELFLIKTFSTEINQNFGQFNQSLGELSSRDYPFAFTSDPIVIGSVYPEGSNSHTVISALAGGGSKTKSPILTANRPAGSAIDAKLSYNWCLHVFGRWK